jgi:WhiB family redox-sensing transcriptional regulator
MVATERSQGPDPMFRLLMRAPDQSELLDEIAGLLSPPAWHDRANCRGVDQKLFFPERGESQAAARMICSACEVRAECLAVALSADMPGIWASTTFNQRRELRKAARSTPSVLADVQDRGAGVPFEPLSGVVERDDLDSFVD